MNLVCCSTRALYFLCNIWIKRILPLLFGHWPQISSPGYDRLLISKYSYLPREQMCHECNLVQYLYLYEASGSLNSTLFLQILLSWVVFLSGLRELLFSGLCWLYPLRFEDPWLSSACCQSDDREGNIKTAADITQNLTKHNSILQKTALHFGITHLCSAQSWTPYPWGGPSLSPGEPLSLELPLDGFLYAATRQRKYSSDSLGYVSMKRSRSHRDYKLQTVFYHYYELAILSERLTNKAISTRLLGVLLTAALDWAKLFHAVLSSDKKEEKKTITTCERKPLAR